MRAFLAFLLALPAAQAASGKPFFTTRPAQCVPLVAPAAVVASPPATKDAAVGHSLANLLAHAPVRISEVRGGWVSIAYTPGQTAEICNETVDLVAKGWVSIRSVRGIFRLARDFIPVMADGKPLFDTPDTNDDSEDNCGVPTRTLDYHEREFVRLNSSRGVCDPAHADNHCGNVEEDRFEIHFVGHEDTGNFLFVRQPRSQHSSATLIEFGPGLEKPKTWLGGKCIENATFPVELRGSSELALKGVALRGSERDPIAKAPDYAVPLTWRFLPARHPPVRAAIAFDVPIEGEALGAVTLPDRAVVPKGGAIAIIGGGRALDESERLAIRFGTAGSTSWVGLDFFDVWRIKWKREALPLIQTLQAREW